MNDERHLWEFRGVQSDRPQYKCLRCGIGTMSPKQEMRECIISAKVDVLDDIFGKEPEFQQLVKKAESMLDRSIERYRLEREVTVSGLAWMRSMRAHDAFNASDNRALFIAGGNTAIRSESYRLRIIKDDAWNSHLAALDALLEFESGKNCDDPAKDE
jgi:hypothetical protein